MRRFPARGGETEEKIDETILVSMGLASLARTDSRREIIRWLHVSVLLGLMCSGLHCHWI